MEKLEKIINYSFKNKCLLEKSLTHSSYAHKNNLENNERLEFLGDSVLGLIVTDFLINNSGLSEGKLSKIKACLVSCEYLSEIVSDLKLEEFIKVSPEELKYNETVKGDFFEALLGALYLDSNLQTCKEFVYKVLDLNLSKIEEVNNNLKDYKTKLQELVQADKGKLEYKVLSCEGLPNNTMFEIELIINDISIAKAKGTSKQKAENEVAKIGIEILKQK